MEISDQYESDLHRVIQDSLSRVSDGTSISYEATKCTRASSTSHACTEIGRASCGRSDSSMAPDDYLEPSVIMASFLSKGEPLRRKQLPKRQAKRPTGHAEMARTPISARKREDREWHKDFMRKIEEYQGRVQQ